MGVKYRCENKRHPATTTPECPLCKEQEENTEQIAAIGCIGLFVLFALSFFPINESQLK
jgi:hypothetical protein